MVFHKSVSDRNSQVFAILLTIMADLLLMR